MDAPAAQLLTGRAGSGPATAVAHVFPGQEEILDDDTIRLAELIDPGFLADAGWEPVTRTLRPQPEHPLLRRPVCAAPGWQTTCSQRADVCLERRRRACAVPGCRRAHLAGR